MDRSDHRLESEGSTPANRRAWLQADPSLDRLTRLAADLLNVSQAAICRLVHGHLDLISGTASDDREPLDIEQFCSAVADRNTALILHGNGDQDGVATGPSTLGAGFYAGLPLHTPAGLLLGVFCIADARPRHGFCAQQTATFETLAGLAADLLQQRVAEESRRNSSALLAALGHDLRTPMNGVLGMAELLLAGDDLAASHRRRIEVIKRSGHTVLTMLESMLDLARLDVCEADAEASSFDFRQLVRKVIGEIERKEAGRAQQFQLVDSSEQYRLHLGNVARIQKLLAHFLEIARGHSAEEPVTIATSTDFTRSGNPQLRLEAEIVCPPNDALGQRFSSSLQAPSITSSKVDEAVVTLILCRKLAAMLGGEIGLERHAEGRSTLWLTIHAHTHQEDYPRSPARNPSERLASSAEMPRTPPRILEVLVAEDDLDMAMLIQDLLEEAGHRATMVHDGTSVLQLLDQKHFDVVLLDGRMPDMSGLETAERIRQLPKIGADIPIIALTGEVLAGDRERYLSAGMDAYVPKPVNYHTLISTIHQCCNH